MISCYYKEPAMYTLDLKEKVYSKLSIQSRFLESGSLASTEITNSMKELNFFNWILFLWKDSKRNQVIIFNGFYEVELYFLLFFSFCRRNNLKIGLDSDTQLNIPSSFFKRVLKKTVLGFLFKNKRVYGFAGGNKSHKELFRYYGMKEERIHFLPMVVDVERFKNINTGKNSNFIFLFVGRIVDVKNIELLINSFKKNFKNSNVGLKIVGKGALLNHFKVLCENISNIEFTGALFGEELKRVYKESHVLVLPSLFEPWGLVVNEAMASGLPVISSKFVGANYDLIENKDTGLIFDPEKEDDLTKKMLEMYQDKVQYEQFSNNAYNLMHNYWNYDLYRKQLLSVVEKMKNA